MAGAPRPPAAVPAADRSADPDTALDLGLVRRAQQGDEQAFGQLVDRHRRAVYRAAYAALGSAGDADDAAQDAFVAAFRNLHAFRGDASFRTWILAIAWRKALDRRRSLTRWLRLAVTGDGRDEDGPGGRRIDAVASPGPSQEEGLAAGELQRMLERLIAALPAKLRDALLLAASGDYTYEQVAHVLGAPVGTVKWRVSEARRLLRQKLAALGYER